MTFSTFFPSPLLASVLLATTVIAMPLHGATHRSTHRHAATNEAAGEESTSATETSDGAGTSSSGFVSANLTEEASHLLVGRSASVSSKQRLNKIYVTDPGVLYAYMASPSEVLITAKQPGVSSLMVWDEGGMSRTYTFAVDLDTEQLRSALKDALPHDEIHVRAAQDHIVLSGNVSTRASYDEAEHLAGLYAKNVSNALIINSNGVQQVRLKVRIVEVDRSKLEQMGINLFSVGGNTLAQSSTSQFPSSLAASTNSQTSSGSGTTVTAGNKTVTISNPLNFLLYNAPLNIGAMLQDMESKQVLQILAEPNITAISGQRANFLAGGEFPFPVVQGSTNGLTSISIQFRPYGVRLDFTPIVNSDGTIQLTVAPEVSALDYTNAVQISGYTIPALSTRRAETQVVLQNGQTFAISGLLDNRMTDQLSRTPGIANVPILGNLFKSKSINHSRTELIVLVTPETIDPLHAELKAPDTSLMQPKMAVPGINQDKFDNSLPKYDQSAPSTTVTGGTQR
ncbi:MAG: type II and III secretion system protein family protein [Acidobacteriaceae bacterium]|nr:type II and III secretion system protein family protein [Acidobacteriaceae bacterium]